MLSKFSGISDLATVLFAAAIDDTAHSHDIKTAGG